MAAIFLESAPCTKDCGRNDTCLKEKLLKDDDPVCRCDEGFSKAKDGKCLGGCSLIKYL